MELMIGMIIGSIVVGMCYSGYSLILGQYGNYKKTKQQVNENMRLHTALSSDFKRSEQVEYREGQLLITLDSSVIGYNFSPALITRTDHEMTDTFHIEAKELKPGFLNNNAGSAIITGLSFNADILGETAPFYYSKNYSAAFFMQHSIQTKNGN
ncbi:MAG: hypothetical protein JWO44_1646 [Bacteroidetes bacterium]|nr:hypothetical protein [Bacteroidota bacterium]